MQDPDAEQRELLVDTWRGVVQARLESRGWWVHVSAFSPHPPRLWLRPDAPGEIEGSLNDLVAEGLLIERALARFEWETDC